MPCVLLVEIDGWVFLVYSGHPLGKFGGICSCAAVVDLTVQLLPWGLTSVLGPWIPGFNVLPFWVESFTVLRYILQYLFSNGHISESLHIRIVFILHVHLMDSLGILFLLNIIHIT